MLWGTLATQSPTKFVDCCHLVQQYYRFYLFIVLFFLYDSTAEPHTCPAVPAPCLLINPFSPFFASFVSLLLSHPSYRGEHLSRTIIAVSREYCVFLTSSLSLYKGTRFERPLLVVLGVTTLVPAFLLLCVVSFLTLSQWYSWIGRDLDWLEVGSATTLERSGAERTSKSHQ